MPCWTRQRAHNTSTEPNVSTAETFVAALTRDNGARANTVLAITPFATHEREKCDHGHSQSAGRSLGLRPHVNRDTESLFECVAAQPTGTPVGTARTSSDRGFVADPAERLRRRLNFRQTASS